MIYDSLKNGNKYFPENKILVEAFDFINKALIDDIQDGTYEIHGKEVYARVMSYNLKGREEAKYEAHREYIDIQAAMRGAEGIEFHLADRLTATNEYNVEKDVTNFRTPAESLGRVDVFPDYFALFFPWDAHMPQLEVQGQPKTVKKIVIKVHVALV